MKKREANFTTFFRHWLKANAFTGSAAFELKQTTTNRLPFSSVKKHQIEALLSAKHRAILYKIPDDAMGIKPFDLCYLKLSEAYIVIRYPEAFFFIDIDDFVKEMKINPEKSLTFFRASVICKKGVKIK